MKYMIQNSIISRGKGKKRRESRDMIQCACVCVVWYGVRDMVERFFIF